MNVSIKVDRAFYLPGGDWLANANGEGDRLLMIINK
jgi:hypothetical protein